MANPAFEMIQGALGHGNHYILKVVTEVRGRSVDWLAVAAGTLCTMNCLQLWHIYLLLCAVYYRSPDDDEKKLHKTYLVELPTIMVKLSAMMCRKLLLT